MYIHVRKKLERVYSWMEIVLAIKGITCQDILVSIQDQPSYNRTLELQIPLIDTYFGLEKPMMGRTYRHLNPRFLCSLL